jgi:hypothetical protein
MKPLCHILGSYILMILSANRSGTHRIGRAQISKCAISMPRF